MMKRFLSVLLALVLGLGLFPAGVQAAEVYSGTCGAEGSEDSVTWKLENGTLTISGTGAMHDYDTNAPSPWNSRREEITTVVVEEGVTALGGGVFDLFTNLTDVTLPDTLTTIGGAAFSYCDSLASITLPDSLTTIGTDAFSHCSSLSSITIPKGMTTIGYRTFSGCTGLTSIIIPEGVTAIETYAFYGCSNLTSITLPDSLTTIGKSAFVYCTSLTSIVIPDGITTIEPGTFYCCKGLTSITLPNTLTAIGENAFGDKAFYNCRLTDVYYDGSRAQWDAITIRQSNSCLDSAAIHCRSYQFTDGNAVSGPLGALSWNYEDSKLDFTFNQPVPEEELVLVAAYDDAGQLVGIHRVTASQAAVQLKDPAKFKLFWLDGRSSPKCWAVTVER